MGVYLSPGDLVYDSWSESKWTLSRFSLCLYSSLSHLGNYDQAKRVYIVAAAVLEVDEQMGAAKIIVMSPCLVNGSDHVQGIHGWVRVNRLRKVDDS